MFISVILFCMIRFTRITLYLGAAAYSPIFLFNNYLIDFMHDACHKLTLAIWSHKDNINGKQGQHVIFINKIEVFFRIQIYIINKIDLLNLFFSSGVWGHVVIKDFLCDTENSELVQHWNNNRIIQQPDSHWHSSLTESIHSLVLHWHCT